MQPIYYPYIARPQYGIYHHQNLFKKRGQSMNNATALKGAAETSEAGSGPVKLLRRIGSTTYEVTIRFSNTSNDKMADIIRRILEREADISE